MHLNEVRELVRGTVVLRAMEKVVYFVRHGESIANARPYEDRMDDALIDAPLTDKGKEQARFLQSVVSEWNVQLVVVSPLTRAIQTACLAFEKQTVPLVAWPLVTEFYPDLPECQGRPREQVENCQNFKDLKRHNEISLDNMHGDWWHINGDMGRLDSVLSWLRCCPENRIAIVCHWGFINNMMEHASFGGALELNNCSWVQTLWHPSPPRGPSASEMAVWLVPDGSTPNTFLDEIFKFYKACAANPELSNSSFIVERGATFHITVTDFMSVEKSDLLQSIQAVGDALRSAVLSCLKEKAPWNIDGEKASVRIDEEKTLYARLCFNSNGLDALTGKLAERVPLFQDSQIVRAAPYSATLIRDNQPEAHTRTLSDFQRVLLESEYPLLSTCLANKHKVMVQEDRRDTEWRHLISSVRWHAVVVTRDESGTVKREPGMTFPLY